MGAHPTACYPFYAYDRPHTVRYYEAAKSGAAAFRDDYLVPYVFDCVDHAAYLRRIGGEATLARLASWSEGTQAWQQLYAEVPA